MLRDCKYSDTYDEVDNERPASPYYAYQNLKKAKAERRKKKEDRMIQEELDKLMSVKMQRTD